MTQTRGLSTRAVSFAGGAVRDVRLEHIEQSLNEAELPNDCADDLLHIFSFRIVEVDAPAKTFRTTEIGPAQNAAKSLLEALRTLPPEILVDIESDIHQARDFIGPRPQTIELYRFLHRISALDGKFSEFSPAMAYRNAVANVFAAFSKVGYDLGTTQVSRAVQNWSIRAA